MPLPGPPQGTPHLPVMSKMKNSLPDQPGRTRIAAATTAIAARMCKAAPAPEVATGRNAALAPRASRQAPAMSTPDAERQRRHQRGDEQPVQDRRERNVEVRAGAGADGEGLGRLAELGNLDELSLPHALGQADRS